MAGAQPRGGVASVHADEGARDAARSCRSPAAKARGCSTSTAAAISTPSARGGSTCSATRIRASTPRSTTQLAQLDARDARGLHARARRSSSPSACAALAPGHLGHAFFASDGASAIEIALKMSFHYWRNRGQAGQARLRRPRRRLSRRDARRAGRHRRRALPRRLRAARAPPAPSCRAPTRALADGALRGGSSRSAAARRARSDRSREHHADDRRADRRAAGAGRRRHGDVRPALPARARASCARRYGVHLIADEIMTGLRPHRHAVRVRAGAASPPDFLCLSKGITGGTLPLSCVLTTDAVYDAFYDDDAARGFLHSHSYTGNPLACRAALAVLDIFARRRRDRRQPRTAARWAALAAPLARASAACATSASAA